MRIEKDSLGTVEVPDECYWGAQTQRSLQHFPAGEPWPPAVISAFGLLKECCAQDNHQVGWLNEKNSNAIIQAAQDVKMAILMRIFLCVYFRQVLAHTAI